MNKIRSILKRASKIDMCYNTCLYIASSWGLDGDSLVFMRVSGGFLRDFLGRSFNMDDEFLVVYKYERFWRGSEPSIYAEIWCFSSYSLLVPISLSMNLRLHSHEFLFPANFLWISDCIPMSPYSKPLDLKTQTAFPWVPIPSQWISRLRMHSMSSYSTAKFLESFGWVPPMSCHPASNVPIETPKNCIMARF